MQKIKEKIVLTPKYIWSNKGQKKIWIPLVVIIAVTLYMIFGGKSSTDVTTYKVEVKEFVQNVSLTGKVISAKNVDMGFETSGRVNRVNFKVGDKVKHEYFGKGVIKSVFGTNIEIDFGSIYGVKELMLEYARLEKIN
mgnify:CR=1 FL=1